jgi:hypothetical protein
MMESNSCEVDVPSVENNHPDFGFNSSDNSDHEEVKSNKLNDPIIQDKPKLNKLQYKNLRKYYTLSLILTECIRYRLQ